MGGKIILVFIVFIIAFVLRFWDLSSIPPSLSHDEVAIGYNAYSILTTGKDEYSTYLPMLFRSFDDYKLPGYIYATVVSMALFGFNEFAVRFTSAFLGFLTVIVFYFLTKEIFFSQARGPASGFPPRLCNASAGKPPAVPAPFDGVGSPSTRVTPRPRGNLENLAAPWRLRNLTCLPARQELEILPLLAAGILAISPWHVNFSRAAFESNGSLFFMVLGTFFLFKALKKPMFFLFCAFSFVVSIYFYYTARIAVPLILIAFAILYRKELLKTKKWVVLSFCFGLILLAPILPHMFTFGFSRIDQVSIFKDLGVTNPYSQAIARNDNSIIAKTFYNRRMAYFDTFFNNYLKNFAPDFYFVNGTGPLGLLYIWEMPFFFYGFFLLITLYEKWKWIFIVWFFSVTLAGGLTTQQPNALRTLANAPIPALCTVIGVYTFYRDLHRLRYRKIFSFILSTVIIFFFLRFLLFYFDYQAYTMANVWGDGHKQMAQFVKEALSGYDRINITGDYWRPYIYTLFYMQYPPDKYQKYGSRYSFDNIYFGVAIWDRGEGINFATEDLTRYIDKKTLFILSTSDFRSQKELLTNKKWLYDFNVIKEIDGIIEKQVFFAVEIK